MNNINNIIEAEQWFLKNSSGGVMCYKGEKSCYCNTFLEAQKYYEKENNE